MRNVKFFIDHLGDQCAPTDWWLKNQEEMQRIYYIKSGTGYFWMNKTKREPFIPGRIYVFPHNMRVKFENDKEDPIDHIFFDFISYPPIIANEPMVYDVKENSPVMKAVELLDCLFRRYDTKAMTESKIPHILDAPDGGFDERRQIFYSSLKLLLTLLSQEKPIPFSNDDSINNALAYIRKNYMNPITVSDLARECGFAPNYFIRRFKSVMKQTPYSYLRAYRLLCASELRASGYTLADAAEAVGYDSANSLSRALRLRKKERKA